MPVLILQPTIFDGSLSRLLYILGFKRKAIHHNVVLALPTLSDIREVRLSLSSFSDFFNLSLLLREVVVQSARYPERLFLQFGVPGNQVAVEDPPPPSHLGSDEYGDESDKNHQPSQREPEPHQLTLRCRSISNALESSGWRFPLGSSAG
jgi:hypothetical protein